MNTTSSRRHQFTLRQMLAWLAVICGALALAGPCLRIVLKPDEVSPNDIISLLVVTLGSAIFLFALVTRLGLAPLRAASTRIAVIDEAIAHGVGLLGLLTHLAIVGSAWMRLCRDYEIPVGEPEVLVFDAHWMLLRHPYLVVPFAAALVVADCQVLASFRRGSRVRLAITWSVLISALFCIITAYVSWALVRIPFGVIHGMRPHYPF